ncbi:MAG TPA: UDP-glucose/GDP-mannose dehydrogenase family protein [Pseudomonadales bacterium]|nr:UDP-glucose/GDP-mannose dehydrogenase family protein [Pseudomonadales bacterium]
MKIAVFGSGYVGLVTGACLAEMGNTVRCVDINKAKIEMLSQGHVPIFEPGLEELVKRNAAAGRLIFTTDQKEAVENSLFMFIAVGTPPEEDGSADLSHVLSVAEGISTHLNKYAIVINKSTVPVGTARLVHNKIQEGLDKRGVKVEFDVVSNPEFLKEGDAVQNFMKPDRIIIGTESEKAIRYLSELYAPFNRNKDRLMVMDPLSSELTKYAANALLATKISFMNEMANIAEKVGADIEKVRQGIGSDPRIGYRFIFPGCGYGGSCFPKDVKALSRIAIDHGYEAKLVTTVDEVNNQQKESLFTKVNAFFKGDLAGKTFALWGLSFKPNTDDMREAPSRNVIDKLVQHGAKVQAYDPEAMEEAKHLYAGVNGFSVVENPMAALNGADGLIIVTEWKVFLSPDFDEIKAALKYPVIFDGRNIYDPELLSSLGIHYIGIGRTNIKK